MKKILLNLCLLFALSIVGAQQTPAVNQSESILIEGATLHIGDGTVVENAMLGIAEGKIIELGAVGTQKNDYANVIDASGQHLYPGFIAANSTVGMVEIDAIRPTNDLNEIGTFLPHIRTIIAYNAESKVVESLRPNGILTAQIVPTRGRIAGVHLSFNLMLGIGKMQALKPTKAFIFIGRDPIEEVIQPKGGSSSIRSKKL